MEHTITVYHDIELNNIEEVELIVTFELESVLENYPSSHDPYQPAESFEPSIYNIELSEDNDITPDEKKILSKWIDENYDSLVKEYEDCSEMWDKVEEITDRNPY